MTEVGPVAWRSSPIRTGRLVLRQPGARDRTAFIELFASPEVRTYLGGSRPRDELERLVPEGPGRRPGLFVVELDGAMTGTVTLDRRDAERPGHIRPDVGEAELGCVFLPEVWGRGYGAEQWFGGYGDAVVIESWPLRVQPRTAFPGPHASRSTPRRSRSREGGRHCDRAWDLPEDCDRAWDLRGKRAAR